MLDKLETLCYSHSVILLWRDPRRRKADIAQLVEHLTCNENVLRSIRGIGSKNKGGVPEWSKGSDCKSDGSAFGGSNPPPTTINVGDLDSGRYYMTTDTESGCVCYR